MGGALQEAGVAYALILGLLLGLRHATDADHVVAVSTIVSESRNAWRGIWIGGSWGLGHTTPLLILGIAILLLKETFLDRYDSVAHYFEFGVGVMLVFLGVQVFWNLKRGRLHVHQHEHEGNPHLHVHATHRPSPDEAEERPSSFFSPGRPVFRAKSYVIGIIHGLAGSAAVMLVLLPSISNFWVGIGYLLLFGLGTIMSMAVITILLGVPFAVSGRFERLNVGVAFVAATASLALGVALMIDVTTGVTLLPI